MKRPNFFIVGAPKCGTTALYEYLQRHSQIYLYSKELYFFGSDFTFRQPRPSLEYYLSLYENVDKEIAIGDASVWYLYARYAAREIHQFNPQAKIIVLLRKPSDVLYSLHSQQFYNGNEDIESFEKALAAEADRKKGLRLPPLIGCPYEALYYSEVVRFSEQLKRYLEVFGREQVKVILFDDFIKKTDVIYGETLSFLGVDTSFKTSYERINANKKIRNVRLRNLLKKRSPALIKTAKMLFPSRRLRQKVLAKLWQANTSYQERPPLDSKLRQQLDEQFRSEVVHLSNLLQQDLIAKWYD